MSTPLAQRPSAPGDERTTRHQAPELDPRPPGRPENFGLDVRRLRRVRMIVFAVLALPILALGLLTVKFVSMPVTQAWHQGAYEEGDYPDAIERLAPVWVVNWFEPYLPHMTKGTDLLQQGENAAAEEELRTALTTWENGKDLNQPLHARCKIINNLSIAIERQADEIEDPGQRGDRLYEAEELMASCAGGGGGGEGEGQGQGGGEGNEDSETTGDNGDRIKEKRREADEQAGKDPDDRGTEQGGPGEEEGGGGAPPVGDPKREDPEGDGPEEEAPTQGDSEDQEKQDELDKRNRDAQEGEGGEGTGGGQDPSKPW